MIKKSVTFLILGLALWSCAESDVEYEEWGEIGLMPVADRVTKTVAGPMDQNSGYNELETFGVFAWYKDSEAGLDWDEWLADAGNASGTGSGAAPIVYLNDEPFCKRNSSDLYWGGGWNDTQIKYEASYTTENHVVTGVKGQSVISGIPTSSITRAPQYWPKNGSLFFAGYSPYKMADYTAATADSDEKWEYTRLNASYSIEDTPALNITGFTQGDYQWHAGERCAENETVDLMWFDLHDEGNLSYDGRTSAAAARFKHACSWIDFKIVTDQEADSKFILTKATLSNMYWTGDFNSGTDSQWGTYSDLRDVVIFENDGKDAMDYIEKFCYITTSGFFLGNMMAIPQALAGKGGRTSQLILEYIQLTSDVTYSPSEDSNKHSSPLTQTSTFDLDHNGLISLWEPGRHYVYTITFGLSAIEIEPKVAEWQEITS